MGLYSLEAAAILEGPRGHFSLSVTFDLVDTETWPGLAETRLSVPTLPSRAHIPRIMVVEQLHQIIVIIFIIVDIIINMQPPGAGDRELGCVRGGPARLAFLFSLLSFPFFLTSVFFLACFLVLPS